MRHLLIPVLSIEGKKGGPYPFYWWEGTPSRYAVKPSVASMFNAARAKAAH